MTTAAEAIEAITDLESAEAELADAVVAVGEGELSEAQDMEMEIERHMPDGPPSTDATVLHSTTANRDDLRDAALSSEPEATATDIASNSSAALDASQHATSAAELVNSDSADKLVTPSETTAATDEPAFNAPTDPRTALEHSALILLPPSASISVEAVKPAEPSPTPAETTLDQSNNVTPAPSSTTADTVTFPPGVSEQSLTVRNNSDLVQAWRLDPSAPKPLYALFDAAVTASEVSEARAWFELLSESSPTSMAPLLQMINLELAHNHFSQVETLFGKALRGPAAGLGACPGVDVWKSYLHYIRRQNSIPSGNSTEAEVVRSTIRKAYEFALRDCGEDRESGDIWKEYIAFLGQGDSTNTWDVQQRMDNVRKAYQKALCIPLNNVEQLWKDYDAFENGLNKLTAKKFLAERSPAYMTARGALRELKSVTEGLSYPIVTSKPTWSESDRASVSAWKKYLKYEEENPLVYSDPSVRITYALRKCLTYMRFFPELWYYAAHYYQKISRPDDAGALLKEGAAANPGSFLLTFAYAEIEEARKDFAACHIAFESLITTLNTQMEELNASIEAEANRLMGPEIDSASLPEANGSDEEEQRATALERMNEDRLARGKPVLTGRQKEVEDLKTAISMVWIMYMRFARRAEGIKIARAVFSKARKSPSVTGQVFEASALMEYHSNKDAAVAIRIFKLGLQLFGEDVPYILRYLNFLISINDDQNSRALFEQFAVSLPAEKARPLWDAWARYEYLYGDLSAVLKLEARFEETFPKDAPLKRFAQRYTYMGVDEIALRDLGFGIRPPQPAAPVVNSMPARTQQRRQDSPPPRQAQPPPRQPSPSRSRDYGDRPPAHRQEPAYKRRAASPPPPTRRFPPEKRWGGARERSPPPMQPIHQDRGPPPMSAPERSGITPALNWFIGSLPNNRSFDGPIFRPDDIMGLFDANPGIAGGPSRQVGHQDHSGGGYRAGPPPPRGRNW